MNELKPCPFCGKKARAIGIDGAAWWVTCDCGIETKLHDTKEKAVETWNRRADDVH